MEVLTEAILNKWKPVLDHAELGQIKDAHRRNTTAVLLENTQKALRVAARYGDQVLLSEASPTNSMGASSSTASDGPLDIFDPVLISLVRRAMPNLMAYDICGVQPMTGPTGLVFAMRTRYANQAGTENWYDEVNTAFSTIVGGNNTIGHQHIGTLPGNTTVNINLYSTNTYNYGKGMDTSTQEALGSNSTLVFPEMAFSIEKVQVTAEGRALKAEYSQEMAQDIKAIHGLDAETELANLLSGELLAEINRQVVRTIFVTAKPGAQENTVTSGVFNLDTDSNGRWMVEKFKGLMAQIEFETNKIAKETRRGKGNIVICSSDVASALQMTGMLSNTPALNGNSLDVDDTGNTYVGTLNGRIKVYIDPYSAGGNFMVVGYKGANKMDAGLFYCPYVPLQMVRAVDPNTFQPKIGFKTRYGMVANPFAEGTTVGAGRLIKDSNVYYRRVIIANLM